MKKSLKSILIIFIALCVLTGAVAIWQRKNIEGIIIGVKESSEEIENRRNDNQSKLVEDVGEVLQEPVREMTEDEKKKIENGEVMTSEVYAQIFGEENEKLKQKTEEAKANEDVSVPSEKDKSIQRDEIITNHMQQLYNLQSQFTARAEATIKQGDRYYEDLKAKTNDKAAARAGTISHFTSTVRSLEAQCDANVEKVLLNLTKELTAIGENTDIVGTIRKTYENEKQLKLAYYANKYLK